MMTNRQITTVCILASVAQIICGMTQQVRYIGDPHAQKEFFMMGVQGLVDIWFLRGTLWLADKYFYNE